MDERQYFVYILTNLRHTVLYVGVTNDLLRRIQEHRLHLVSGFTSRYNIGKLVYFEACDDVAVAIAREKQLKGGSREQKIALIESVNPEWQDRYPELV